MTTAAIYYTLSHAEKPIIAPKAPRAAKSARTGKDVKKAPKATPAAKAAACAAFDESWLTTLIKDAVHIQVSGYLAELERRFDTKVKDSLARLLK